MARHNTTSLAHPDSWEEVDKPIVAVVDAESAHSLRSVESIKQKGYSGTGSSERVILGPSIVQVEPHTPSQQPGSAYATTSTLPSIVTSSPLVVHDSRSTAPHVPSPSPTEGSVLDTSTSPDKNQESSYFEDDCAMVFIVATILGGVGTSFAWLLFVAYAGEYHGSNEGKALDMLYLFTRKGVMLSAFKSLMWVLTFLTATFKTVFFCFAAYSYYTLLRRLIVFSYSSINERVSSCLTIPSALPRHNALPLLLTFILAIPNVLLSTLYYSGAQGVVMLIFHTFLFIGFASDWSVRVALSIPFDIIARAWVGIDTQKEMKELKERLKEMEMLVGEKLG